MTEEEQKAIEILDTFELRRKTKNYNKLDLNDVYASQIALNLISKLQEENKELREGKDTAENELKSQLEINEQLHADIELKNETISKAIGHIETCKTSMGNYILSPNETEYLLEILKGETENDTKNK